MKPSTLLACMYSGTGSLALVASLTEHSAGFCWLAALFYCVSVCLFLASWFER